MVPTAGTDACRVMRRSRNRRILSPWTSPPPPLEPAPPLSPVSPSAPARGWAARIGPGWAGFLAGCVALFVLLLGTVANGANGFLELVANGTTAYVPLPIFDAILQALGPLAKGLLFVGVSLAVPAAGALLALALARWGGLDRRSGLWMVLEATGWSFLAAESIALPIFGQGFFGTSYAGDLLALQVPILLAALTYGVVLVGIVRGIAPAAGSANIGAASTATPGDLDRRSFIGRGLAVLGGVSLVASGAVVASRVATAAGKPYGSGPVPEGDAWGPTPQVTPLNRFYVVGKDLVPTSVDVASWSLSISGLVTAPLTWTLADLAKLPRVEGYRTLQCISNEVVSYGQLISNQWWGGVRMRDVLDAVGVQPTATYVLWRSADGYTESLPIDVARDERTWLVSEMASAGTPLPTDHGFPLRVLIAGRYGMKQPKYLVGIELADHDEQGYWEQRGWDEQAVVRTYSRIDAPRLGADVVAGQPFTVYGIASAGDRGIGKVELSIDDGATWADAELEPTTAGASDLTWRRWRSTVTVPAGRVTLVARATDGQGGIQDDVPRPTLPSGATGLHRVQIVAAPAS